MCVQIAERTYAPSVSRYAAAIRSVVLDDCACAAFHHRSDRPCAPAKRSRIM